MHSQIEEKKSIHLCTTDSSRQQTKAWWFLVNKFHVEVVGQLSLVNSRIEKQLQSRPENIETWWFLMNKFHVDVDRHDLPVHSWIKKNSSHHHKPDYYTQQNKIWWFLINKFHVEALGRCYLFNSQIEIN